MELRQLKYFLGVAEDLHFSKAAEKLFVAQPALSRQIQQLEDEWGVLLFERDKRNVKLTPAGEFLKEEVKKLLNQVENIKKRTRQIQHGEEGEIRIGHPGSAVYSVIPELLVALNEKYPKIKVTLGEILEVDLVKSIQNASIDVGFIRESPFDNNLSSKVLFRENFALVIPDNHWLNEENFENMGQLKNESFILPPKHAGETYYNVLLGICQREDFLPEIMFESNFGATILRLVEHNLGVSILPVSYKYGSNLKVRFLELKNIPEKTELSMVWRKDDNNPVLKSFLKVANMLTFGMD